MGRRWPVLLLLLVVISCSVLAADGNAVFELRRKFPRRGASLAELRAHDEHRRGRFLAAIDLPMGGVGTPTMNGLYYAELGIGTPSKNYHVQVDTGSDILWVNCFNCNHCPKKTNLGFELKLYNPKESSAARLVTCDDSFCSSTYGGKIDGCLPGIPCQYSLLYGDGSGTTGFFVSDVLQYNQVSGNMQTFIANTSVIFGCGSQQSGELGSSSEALDGILGFGQANSSMLSQLASSGKTRKMFAHCLDNRNGGGGIFAIGNVVKPKVRTTPLVPNQPHYNVNMKAIDVDGKFLTLPTDIFDTTSKTGTIIDSGTTLSYLPDAAHSAVMSEIMGQRYIPQESQGFTCFEYTANVDDGFPIITFHFENSLTLKVYPHDYLFELQDDLWCFGFQTSTSQSNEKNYFLLGDLVLSNKLVFYDIENQAIGWTEYNCSSSISVQDDKTGGIYKVGAHTISFSAKSDARGTMFVLILTAILHYFVSR